MADQTEVAIITERLPTGEPRYRTSQSGLTVAARRQAEALDRALEREIRELENRLVARELLPAEIPSEGEKLPRGDVRTWHAVGTGLHKVTTKHGISGARERRWLWEAIQNLHASKRISRAGRGRTRNHFEYCYRLAQFPPAFASQIKWSEWVYFFDSRTVREETRIDEWLQRLIQRGEKITRQSFRRFSELLNDRISKLDTSVLNKRELFAIYDSAWENAGRDLSNKSTSPQPAQDSKKPGSGLGA